MPYFFIVPAFLLLFLGLLAGGLLLRFTRLKKAAPFAFGAAIGSLAGFVGANGMLWALVYGALQLMPQATTHLEPTGWLSALTALSAVGMLIIMPMLASAAGTIVGAVAGLYLAMRRAQRQS